MKRKLILAMMMVALILNGINIGHAQSPSSGNKISTKQSRKRKLRLGLVGYLLLPRGYKVYRTGRTVDAWGGYILSPDNSLRIEWSAGMVQHPFADGEDKFLWVKRENIGKGNLQYGLKQTDEGEIIVATVGWAHFTMHVKSEGNLDKFLGVVRGYRVKQCNNDCESLLPATPSNNSFNRSAI